MIRLCRGSYQRILMGNSYIWEPPNNSICTSYIKFVLLQKRKSNFCNDAEGNVTKNEAVRALPDPLEAPEFNQVISETFHYMAPEFLVLFLFEKQFHFLFCVSLLILTSLISPKLARKKTLNDISLSTKSQVKSSKLY